MAVDWENYETGPFCRHWSDPSMCDRTCATCGHECHLHAFGDGAPTECSVRDCECEEWADEADD